MGRATCISFYVKKVKSGSALALAGVCSVMGTTNN
jgi:hypothetical protein